MEKDDIKEALEAFEECVDAESENRRDALDDIEFARLSKQWPDAIRQQREREGRPCLTINRMPTFIRQVVNDGRMNRPSIAVHPVGDGADQDTAEILNGLIRNIQVISDAEVAYDSGLDAAVTGGFGYWRVDIEEAAEDSFDFDLKIGRIANPFTVYGDPRSQAADSSDWNVSFVVDSLTREEFKKRWPGREETEFEADRASRSQLWFGDDDIQIAEYWSRSQIEQEIVATADGGVYWAKDLERILPVLQAAGIQIVGTRMSKTWKVSQRIMTGAEFVEETSWHGKYIPIIPVYGDEVNVEGKRYFRSLIRDGKDPQRMFNYWRTASTELVALAPRAPWVGPKGAFMTDAIKWASANTQNHAYIEYDGATPPQRQPFAGVPAGALQEALNANDDMKSVIGLHDASLGARSNETSGRAIMARQREGDVATFHFLDNQARAIRHTGRVLIDLIPKIYTAPRMLRILQDDGSPQTVAVNYQVPPEGVAKVYSLTTGKYDVTVSTGPTFTSRREEAAAQMSELVRANPAVFGLVGDLLVKNFDWPGADDIAKRLKAMLPPQVQQLEQQQGNAQMALQALQQTQQQLQMAEQAVNALKQQLQAEREQNQADLIKAQADAQRAQIEGQKVQVMAFEAETDRMKVEAEARARALELLQPPAPAPMPAPVEGVA